MKEPNRRRVLQAGIGAAAASLSPFAARAQGAYPNRPVRLIVPFPAGGPSDNLGRLLGQQLSDRWKQPVVVENRPGASGTIGANLVAKAAPDGYSLLLAAGASNGSAEVLNPKTVPYRTLRDFAPIGFVGITPTLMVVSSDLPVKDVREFVALVKANPGKYSYGNASQGSAPHFAFEMLKLLTGIDLLEVPFNGAPPAITALGGGQVQTYMGSVFSSAPVLQTGRAKPIGVASAHRIESMPNIPTLAEQGFPVVWDTWYGLLAPAGTPDAILDKINADMNAAFKGDDIRQQMAKMGLDLRTGTRKDMLDAVTTEIENATRVAKQAKMIKD